MKCVLYLSFLITAINCHVATGSEKDKIVGGDYITIDKAPYFAQILQSGEQICGGSIIGLKWILTAAHCVTSLKITVITGSAIEDKQIQRRVANIIVHEYYDEITFDNDIALIKLKEPIQVNKDQKPIKISIRPPKAGDLLKVSGFGKEGEYLGYSKTLKAAYIPTVDQEECKKAYAKNGDEITDNMFCGGRGPTDTCQGDSGGPTVLNNKLVGIVSFGMECGSTEYPGVYTQLYKYRLWIAKKTKMNL